MNDVYGLRKRRNAQTMVFFLLSWGTIMLLAGMAIDTGLLYLAKARMGRAVDGAALAAVGNFNRSGVPSVNRDEVAIIMRNFAVANFTDLASISSTIATPGGTPATATASNGTTSTTYSYNFTDGTQDVNGAFRRFVQVTLATRRGRRDHERDLQLALPGANLFHRLRHLCDRRPAEREDRRLFRPDRAGGPEGLLLRAGHAPTRA